MLLGEGIKVKFLDSEQREQIGFSFIIDNLEIMTPFGMEEKKKTAPFNNKKILDQEFSNIEALIQAIQNDKSALGEIERVFCRIKDVSTTTNRCRELITLDDVELYEIKYFALLIEELIAAYEKFDIEISYIKLNSLRKVIDILDPENKKISTFYIYDAYSENLKEIRKEKRRLEELISKEINEEKVKELINKRMNVVILEEEEELKVRKLLTEKLSSYADAIKENINSIGKLDFLIAKGKLALKFNAIKPKMIEDTKISLRDMFNPKIEEVLQAKEKSFTPISIELNSGITVITGANMGGKSVALKTIVLNLLLAQCGFFVFAKEAKVPKLDFIYFISDDMQSVSQGLSTFGAEIVKIKKVIEDVKRENGFIALDEFARGTNPKEGYFLVKSLCKYLNSYSSISLISTHYDKVAEKNMTHYQVAGLKNVDFNLLKNKIDSNKMNSISLIQEHMDYKLERVSSYNEVPKDALNIALLLGLQNEVIDIAREYYDLEYKEYKGED